MKTRRFQEASVCLRISAVQLFSQLWTPLCGKGSLKVLSKTLQPVQLNSFTYCHQAPDRTRWTLKSSPFTLAVFRGEKLASVREINHKSFSDRSEQIIRQSGPVTEEAKKKFTEAIHCEKELKRLSVTWIVVYSDTLNEVNENSSYDNLGHPVSWWAEISKKKKEKRSAK